MDKVTLIDLIEGETAKLSPRDRELWEEMETLVELSEGISPRDRKGTGGFRTWYAGGEYSDGTKASGVINIF